MPSAPERFSQRLIRQWYEPGSGGINPTERLLLGLIEAVYGTLWQIRRLWVATFARPRRHEGVRVIAVGNLIAGGAGKTPTVIALGLAMRNANLACGLIFRGYKSQAEHGPVRVVTPQDLAFTSAQTIGDEAWLACWRTGLPVAIGKDRFAALAALKSAHPNLEVAILDDGLQQTRLAFDQSILVTDARGFGNQRLIPAGPLREPIGNLQRFDAWVHQETRGPMARDTMAARHAMPTLQSVLLQRQTAWVPLAHWQEPNRWMDFEEGLARFRGKSILAAAGIAVPARFFELLHQHGLACKTLPLADHDPQTTARILAAQHAGTFDVILMTEKDAVKFFADKTNVPDNAWALRRDAALDEHFLNRLIHGPQTS